LVSPHLGLCDNSVLLGERRKRKAQPSESAAPQVQESDSPGYLGESAVPPVVPKDQEGVFRQNGVCPESDHGVLKTAKRQLALPQRRSSDMAGASGPFGKDHVSALEPVCLSFRWSEIHLEDVG
jgi:hypothetical protein